MADVTSTTKTNWFADMLTDTNGGISEVRVMSLICMILFVFMVIMFVLKWFGLATADAATAFQNSANSVIYVMIIVAVAAFCPKVIQKFAEIKLAGMTRDPSQDPNSAPGQ